MRCRLEKINHIKRQRRFYELAVVRTLFGEWCLRRTWGRLGSPSGREMHEYFDGLDGAKAAFLRMKRKKSERGYGVIPVQLELFE
ncbi:WGR domain-containing protein (plasmid) [Shimia sp. W99]